MTRIKEEMELDDFNIKDMMYLKTDGSNGISFLKKKKKKPNAPYFHSNICLVWTVMRYCMDSVLICPECKDNKC